MRAISIILIALLCLLQYRMWFGDSNISDVMTLAKQVDEQRQKVAFLSERNRRLAAEVTDLKHRLGAIEERARMDLGMVREGETFYQLIEPDVSAENEIHG